MISQKEMFLPLFSGYSFRKIRAVSKFTNPGDGCQRQPAQLGFHFLKNRRGKSQVPTEKTALWKSRPRKLHGIAVPSAIFSRRGSAQENPRDAANDNGSCSAILISASNPASGKSGSIFGANWPRFPENGKLKEDFQVSHALFTKKGQIKSRKNWPFDPERLESDRENPQTASFEVKYKIGKRRTSLDLYEKE